MVKNHHRLSTFDILARIYVIFSVVLFCRFTTSLTVLNLINTLFLETIYTVLSWLFSFVIFWWILSTAEKMKHTLSNHHDLIRFHLSRMNLSAIVVWCLLTVGCLSHSTQLLFSQGFLRSDFLTSLLIVQFFLSIYLITFLATVFGIIFAWKKSQNLEINILPSGAISYSEGVRGQSSFKRMFVIINWSRWSRRLWTAIQWFKNLSCCRFFACQVQFLILNNLKSKALRLDKKQSRPPHLLFI